MHLAKAMIIGIFSSMALLEFDIAGESVALGSAIAIVAVVVVSVELAILGGTVFQTCAE